MYIFSFILLALFWGGSFLGIGIAVKQLPPFFAAFFRVLVAFVCIVGYLLIKKQKIAKPKVWLQSMGTGAFSMGIPWLFLFWGEKHIQPALAAILNSTVPIFAVLLTPWLTPADKLSRNKWVGVLIGFAGVSLIFGPEITLGPSLSFQGMIAILLMAVCYAIGLLWMRRIAPAINSSLSLFYQTLSGGLILLTFTTLFELPHQAIVFSWPASLALLYLGIFSTAIAWLFFFRLVKEVGSIPAAAVTYLIPLVALILDFFFWDKWITLHQAIGACIILLGVFLIHRPEQTRM